MAYAVYQKWREIIRDCIDSLIGQMFKDFENSIDVRALGALASVLTLGVRSGFMRGHLVRRLQFEEHEVTTFDERDFRQGTRVIKGDIASFDFRSVLKDV